jgi:hypothetical protein
LYISLGEEIPSQLAPNEEMSLTNGIDTPEGNDLTLILGALKDLVKVRQGQIKM